MEAYPKILVNKKNDILQRKEILTERSEKRGRKELENIVCVFINMLG